MRYRRRRRAFRGRRVSRRVFSRGRGGRRSFRGRRRGSAGRLRIGYRM